LITSSGWRNKVQASQGGVGLLLDQKSWRAILKKVRSVNKIIMIADFDSNPKTSCHLLIHKGCRRGSSGRILQRPREYTTGYPCQ